MKTIQKHTIVSRTKTGPGTRVPAILLYLMLSLLVTLTACEEPIGNQGPQGPQGPQGLEGPEGPIGPAGEDGSMMYAGTGAPGDDIGSVGDYYLNQNTGEYYGPKDADGWGNSIIVLKGEDGQDGADGQDGQDGADGEDGSQIYAGSGAPDAAVGVPGDYYLDRDNYELYGPKTSSGWGAPLNLQGPRGPAGPAGEDGSMIYAGYGPPSIDIGSPGDYYLNGTTGELYGPKSANGWGGPILILKGEDGEDGQDGQDGADGEDGSQIYAGSGAPDAAVGVLGDYYLDRDNYELYGPKTNSGWGPPLNLRGPVGPAGEDGSIMYAGEGVPGDDIGQNGDYYLNQNTGELYGPKDAGGWGEPIIVLKGEDGQDGTDGQDGEDGSQIHAGSGAPTDDLGKEGDFYLNKDSYELYGPKTSDGWGTPLNLKGADGNANVTRYIFPGHNYSESETSYHFPDVTTAEMEESAWLVYLVYESNAYPVPGIVYDGQYRVFLNFSRRQVAVSLEEEPGASFDNIYIIRIEATATEDHTKRAGGTIIPDHLDVSNYKEVAEYYGFYR